MHSSRFLSLLLAPALGSFVGFLGAQAPTDAPSLATLARGHGLQATADGLLGTGSDYVVRFDHNGMHFVPVLGERTACEPLQLQLAAIRRGSTALPCDTVDAPNAADDVAIYQRSPSITERFTLHDRGVEQSFVFTTLPGRGDLVVRCRLDGLGDHAVPASDGGLDFVRDGERLVHMGGVVGIDANGARTTGAVRLDGEFVELSLPARFVDCAALPLVLDPFVGSTVSLATGATVDRMPHVAYEGAAQRWQFVWERVVSSTQIDVVRRTWTPVGGLGALQTIASGLDQLNQKPRIAYHTGIARSLVVFERRGTPLDLASLTGCVLNTNQSQGSPFPLGTTTIGSFEDPDVSGDPTGNQAGAQGLIVYRLDGVTQGIRCRPYTLLVNGDPQIGPQITVTTQATAVRPRISKSAGATLAIAFEQKPGAFSGVFVQAITRTGTLLGAAAGVLNPSGPDLHRPEIDGTGPRFLMVAEYQASATDRDVSAIEWLWNGTSFGPPVSQGAVANTLGADESAPVVAFLGQKYAVAWQRTVGFLAGSVQCRSISPTGCLACGPALLIPIAGNNTFQPAIGGDIAGGGNGTSALLACMATSTTVPPSTDVVAMQWNTNNNPPPATLASGCGFPTTLQVLGASSIGNTNYGFRVQTTDPLGVIGLFSFGFAIADPLLPCGSCMLVNPAVLDAQLLVGGQATFPLPLPCNLAFLGVQLQVQGSVLGSAQNVCPLLNTLSSSAPIGVTIAD